MTYRPEFVQAPRLTAEQERALADRIQAGDQDARNELVLHHVGLALNIAFGYARSCPLLSEDDLVQEAFMGLLHAARLYDPDKGRYSTNATNWVRQCCSAAIRRNAYPVRIPEMCAPLLKRAMPAKSDRAEWLAVQRWLAPVLPLSRHLDENESEGDTFASLLVDEGPAAQDLVEREEEQEEARERVQKLLADLTERQRSAVELYYGLSGRQPMSALAIAREWGCTWQNVSSTVDRAMKTLRRIAGQQEGKHA